MSQVQILMRNIEKEISGWKHRLDAPDRPWDPQLITDARRGNQDAVKLLVGRVERKLAKIIEVRLRDIPVSDKEDIMQETLAKIYRKIDSSGFSWSKEGLFLQFAVLTVTGAIANHVKAAALSKKAVNSVNPDLLMFSGSFRPVLEDLIAKEDLGRLRRAIDRMPEKDRRLVECMMQGLSTSKISEGLGMSRVSVHYRIDRLRGALREAYIE